MTAAEVAEQASDWLGLGWDRSTVTRIELGQRQVTAAELMVLPVLYNRSIAELLPTEPCQLTQDVRADPAVLRTALTRGARGYDLQRIRGAIPAARANLRGSAQKAEARFPGVPGMVIIAGASRVKDQIVVKSAQRLGADPWDVAVAAQLTWERDLTAERDARVGKKSESMRATQARRGHVTRALLEELRPVVDQLQAARDTKEHPDGER